MTLPERRLIRFVEPAPGWLLAVCLAVFALYALNFLYFFVDDEGIPFVYAQNVLHGHGLAYTTLEGPVEGYSDFLHVGLATAILRVVHAAELPKISVFFIGKAISFACGLAIVGLVWTLVQRLRLGTAGTIAGMAIVCLSGPLAVWSCSSLETAAFALGVMGLVYALTVNRDGAALACAAFLILERIDGFIYAGILLAAFSACADAARRRVLLRRIVVPAVVCAIAYHGWRFWYFDDLVPAPVEAKVLYKLTGHTSFVRKSPHVPYILNFAHMYGWIGSFAFVLAAVAALRAGGPFRALAIATAGLIAYVAVVGDWMFGFRFFVAVTGLVAVLMAVAVHELAVWRRWTAALACTVIAYVAGTTAFGFFSAFHVLEARESFLRHPSRDPHQYFQGYYALYETARRLMFPGQVVAYNQAGFIPFMLDLENIDDLGICSRFYANMPTTDVFFTEVGRYTPLTRHQPLGAAAAYLLYRNAQFLIVRRDLLMTANHGVVPPDLLDCHYELLASDAMGQNAIYVRTSKDADEYRMDARAFAENLAHVSRLRTASIDGEKISPAKYLERFPYLSGGTGELAFTDRKQIDVVFARGDEDVAKLTADEIACDQAADVMLWLLNERHEAVHTTRIALAGLPERSLEHTVGAPASRLGIELTGPAGVPTHCVLGDVRVMGQSRALAEYTKRSLRFPAPK